MNPLTTAPRLVLRALDDLHALARAATSVDARLGDLEDRAEAVLAAVERLEAKGDGVLALGDRLDTRGDQLLAKADVLRDSADEVARQGGEVALALPTLERALETIDTVSVSAAQLVALIEPLQGATERLGRVVDRLPGAARAPRNKARSPSAAKGPSA